MSDATSPTKASQGFELDLGRVGLIVIIPVSLWAFYTTFQGIRTSPGKGPKTCSGSSARSLVQPRS